MIRHLTAAIALAMAASNLHAQSLLKEVSKDFGSVPQGTVLTHQFPLHNHLSSTVTVSGLRTSCTCATASVGKSELKPGESTVVAVTIDTNRYVGSRTFTIYLLLGQPILQELQMVVSATSRQDVTLNPGQLNFGRVKRGNIPPCSVTVDYRGLADFRITGVENDNSFIQPTLEEKTRVQGQVSYALTAKLRGDTPAGAWHADVWLKTNDASIPRIRVPLVVHIESVLSITPSEVNLGRVAAGGKSEYRITVRGPRAFKVLKVDGGDERFQLTWSTDQAKQVHIIRLTLQAGADAADVLATFKVITDLAEETEGEFSVTAQIAP
jgi:hypothetical protein